MASIIFPNLQKEAPEVFLRKRKRLAQLLSFEFCEIFKNPFFTGHLRAAASESTVATDSSFPESLSCRHVPIAFHVVFS